MGAERLATTDYYELNVAILDRYFEVNGHGSIEKLALAVGRTRELFKQLRKERRLPTGEALFRISEATGIPVAKLAVRIPRKS